MRLSQTQSLQQRLSPQQVLFLKMLQLPLPILEQRISEELAENPVLETESAEESADESGAEPLDEDESPVAEVEAGAEASGSGESAPLDGEVGPSADPLRDEERLERIEEDERKREAEAQEKADDPEQEDDSDGYKTGSQSSAGDGGNALLQIAASLSFEDFLEAQIKDLDLPEHLHYLADTIIGYLDKGDGYLRTKYPEVIHDAEVQGGYEYTEAEALAVLRTIQRLEPVGIACRDLQECLLTQLSVMKKTVEGRDLARRMLTERFTDVTNRRFKSLEKHLGVTPEELATAFNLIQKLNPKPGGSFGASTALDGAITPDFLIEHTPDRKEIVITLNERGIPSLRINTGYRAKIMRDLDHSAKHLGPQSQAFQKQKAQTHVFLKQKIESAKFFIQAIQERRQTMMRVMRAIVEHQRDFFDHGALHLKPLIYKTIAEDIGMNISTVCRVVNGKYCQTEHGVHELKYFFSQAIPLHISMDGSDDAAEGGEGTDTVVSNKVVRSHIQEMIRHEPHDAPLSDDAIVEKLQTMGFHIARRTVAKYRSQLKIPVARLRRTI